MTCQLRVLGCSGGIGGDNRTTSFLLNEHILIDAGTGVADLSLAQLLVIDHVFLTHAHLDHIACLPLLLDTVIGVRKSPVYVHATAATIQILRQHIFNWLIWPDFAVLPSAEQPCLVFIEQEVGTACQVGEAAITPLPAIHTVPAVGFLLESKQAALVFSGDTIGGVDFWQAVNRADQLKRVKALIIETAFADKEAQLADSAKHLCPSTLARELAQWQSDAEVLITHLKPVDSEVTIREVLAGNHRHPIRRLLQGEVIDF